MARSQHTYAKKLREIEKKREGRREAGAEGESTKESGYE